MSGIPLGAISSDFLAESALRYVMSIQTDKQKEEKLTHFRNSIQPEINEELKKLQVITQFSQAIQGKDFQNAIKIMAANSVRFIYYFFFFQIMILIHI